MTRSCGPLQAIIIHFHQSGFRTFKEYHQAKSLFGDKGYVSHKLVAQLLESCKVQLVTFDRANVLGRLLHHDDVLLLRKRAIMETINDQLKNISQIEHSCYCSPLNFVVNLMAGLIAYCL